MHIVGTNNVEKGWMDGNKGRGFSLENRNCQDSHSASWHISLNFQNRVFHLSKLEQLYSNTLHNIQNAGGSCHFIGRQQWREGERGGEILGWGFVNKILQYFRFFDCHLCCSLTSRLVFFVVREVISLVPFRPVLTCPTSLWTACIFVCFRFIPKNYVQC